MKKVKLMQTFIECGCCGSYHLDTYHGDCRDDYNRFYLNDFDAMISYRGARSYTDFKIIDLEEQMKGSD
jgi:hypothetical protein